MDTSIVLQKQYIVYVITCLVNGKKYVGITVQGLDLRLRGHFSKAKSIRDNRKFYNAIRKHGEDNFRIEHLDSASSYDELREKEKQYIKELDTYNTGYNSTLGGDGTLGAITSEETREKHRQHKIEHFSIKENRDRLSRKNAVLSDEQVLEICELAKTGEFLIPQIADKFNVGPATVSEILNFRTYRHVSREFIGGKLSVSAKLRLEMDNILSLYHQGLEYSEIGEKVGLDANTVWRKLKDSMGCSPVSPDMRRVDERNRKIVDERNAGERIRSIAKDVGVSMDTVRKQLKKAGIFKPDERQRKDGTPYRTGAE